MLFKKNKLAICIALAAMVPAAVAVAQNTDSLSAYGSSVQKEQTLTYFVYLSEVGSLTKATVNNKKKLAESLKRVEAAQQTVVSAILALDGNIEQLPGVRLLGNFIRIRADASYAAEIEKIAGVKAVVAEMTAVRIPANALSKPAASASVKMASNAPALSSDATAGAGIKIAIIGTGVDYTHIGLGGDGSAATYAAAMENAVNAFDGFPTDVVVEGMDFSSDAGWGLDPNPIDQNVYFTRDYDGSTHNTGHGTRLASVVHALAPGASIAAYKTSNVSDPYGSGYRLAPESSSTFMMALEYALDPNQDGSFDDRADIIVVDAVGGNAFYAPSDSGISSPVVEAHAIEMASALGSLVVVNAGNGGVWSDNKFNMTWRGAAPSALTVGGMTQDGDKMMVTERTPYGPVRGANGYAKPDMVSFAENIDVAVVGGGDELDTASDTVMAAARVAAAAAVLKSERPELSMVEVKALLMNTANSAVLDLSSQQADMTLIGNGVEDLEAALASSVVAWEKNSYQPNLSFGFEEGMGVQRFVKEVQLKNLSDATVTYDLAIDSMGKEGDKALMWEHPATVSVPAGQTLVFPVVLEIDFAKLDNWPIKTAEDFTAENWSKIELSGKLLLTAEGKPTISMNWLAKPRAGTKISRDFSTFEESFGNNFSNKFSPTAGAYMQEFTNESSTETQFGVFPVMHRQLQIPAGKENVQGNIPSLVGGGVYDEAMCSTGKKLVIAGRFFKPNDAGLANHFDKGGAALMWWNVYQEQFVLDNGFDEAVNGEPYAWDPANQIVTSGFVEVDENIQPVSWYIDHNMEYDYTQPRARYKKSKLPTYITGHGQNFVSQFCLEDLYHGEAVASVDDFDKNHGWIFATDRDAVADIGEPIIQYNPVKYGKVEKIEYFDWMTGQMLEMEVKGGGLPMMARLVEEGETKEYSPMLTLAAGETVEFAMTNECSFSFMIGSSGGCNNSGMMLMSLNDNWSMWSPMAMGDYSPLAQPVDGQSHNIDEDAEIGSVVAQLELGAEQFFAWAGFDNQYNPYELKLANALPGDPFILSNTGEIIVNNPAALDYDMGNLSYNLEVIGRQGNSYTAVANVKVIINNVNDIAPEVIAEVAAVSVEENGSVAIDMSAYFFEAEGDALTYTATGLPAGMTIDSVSGLIDGQVQAGSAGEYQVTVTADDTVNQTSTDFSLTVNAQPEPEPVKSDDGGSLGLALLSLLGLLGLRRKVRR